jgi:hypothetical protein
MTVGKGGEEYEKKVMAVLNRNIKKLPKLKIKELPAGFASNLPDLVLLYGDTEIRVEIKMDIEAQMGGGSYNYDKKTGKFFASEKTVVDPGIHDMIMDILNSKKAALDKLLLYAKKNAPRLLAESIKGLPLTAPRKLWDALRDKSYLRPLNGKIEVGVDFLHDHYAKKKCYYIQIGGYGLFYLKENPLNLPVPQLNTAMNLELRLGAAGSKMNQTLKMKVASGNMRVQGRLKKQGASKSPYSLENGDQFVRLFGSLTNADLERLKNKMK